MDMVVDVYVVVGVGVIVDFMELGGDVFEKCF